MNITAHSFQYYLIKDIVAPIMLKSRQLLKSKKNKPKNPLFAPPLKSARRLKEIMTRHFFLARYAKGTFPVAWVTSGAPVELLRVFDCYTIYPENHGALCGAQKIGAKLCSIAEEHGYHPDLCSYSRIDLGHYFSGQTPAGKLPKPDLLLCSNNICQTIAYWFKALAHYWEIPLLIFDTPYNFGEITAGDINYMVRQLEAMIPQLEKITGRKFNHQKFKKIIGMARESSQLWGQILDTMKNRPAPMTIFDAFVHLAPIVALRGLPVCLDYYQGLLSELQDRVNKNIGALASEKKRLIWDNIAIWYKIRDLSELFAQRGFNFVTATYTNAWKETAGYLDMEHPFESMAKTYSLVILNNNLNHRLQLMERLIKEYQVDGMVIHSARSCKPYSVGQYDLKRLLAQRLDLPSVIIEADIADARVYAEKQINVRLEAFFENLYN